MQYHLAIDIGASGGRHVLGWVEDGKIHMEEIYRFPNQMVRKHDRLCWDADRIFRHILDGMKQCAESGKIPATLGIDTWAVDFVLLDRAGERLCDAVAYRDGRTEGMAQLLEQKLPFAELYGETGIQKQPFNTIYQLLALKRESPDLLEHAESFLMLPDYFHFLLTGEKLQEYTNATTTSLVNARTGRWSEALLERVALPGRLFGPLSMPGTPAGTLRAQVAAQAGFNCRVVLPATHDTASAFLAAAAGEGSIVLSSGTWSLMGVETERPVLSDDARRANYTNSGGYGGRFAFLKNIMGLWMLQRVRDEAAEQHSYTALSAMAERAAFPSSVPCNDSRFLAPAAMTLEIQDCCRESGQAVPRTLGETVSVVYNSLAECYRQTAEELERIAGRRFSTVRIAGGGSKDGYLNRLTAARTGKRVLAGPAEASALGNLLAQMLGTGEFESVAAARASVAASFPLETVDS